MNRALLKKIPLVRWGYRCLRYVAGYFSFAADFIRFRSLSQGRMGRFPVKWAHRFPCLYDKTSNTGFDSHYIYHPAWAARIIADTKPPEHLDISSSLHFCTIVSAFVPVRFYDYRPAAIHLDGLTSAAMDLLDLPFADNSVQSLSCMHVVEHVGLGRYGDPIDPDGDLRAMSELCRVLAPGGNLLFVVPVGKPKLMFNAHRIYSLQQIIERFSDLALKEFALVPDDFAEAGLIRDASAALVEKQNYGCGCFWFQKPR